LAEKAVASNPTSSPTKLALAYVQQAFFNVEAARSTMQSAATDNPDNALVWARLSELWLATGYLNEALSAAKKSVVLSPDISRTQTVLGYAYISQIKIINAKEAFQKAIALDQADPLPRLGLGLALIREGDLKAGRAQIEIAAGLDPGNALVRSSLGKAEGGSTRKKRTTWPPGNMRLPKSWIPMIPRRIFMTPSASKLSIVQWKHCMICKNRLS